MTEQWQELKETVTELRDNDGTGTQQEACKFLVNLMDVLEKQIQEPKTGHWKERRSRVTGHIEIVCSECGAEKSYPYNDYCGNCGAKMD